MYGEIYPMIPQQRPDSRAMFPCPQFRLDSLQHCKLEESDKDHILIDVWEKQSETKNLGKLTEATMSALSIYIEHKCCRQTRGKRMLTTMFCKHCRHTERICTFKPMKTPTSCVKTLKKQTGFWWTGRTIELWKSWKAKFALPFLHRLSVPLLTTLFFGWACHFLCGEFHFQLTGLPKKKENAFGINHRACTVGLLRAYGGADWEGKEAFEHQLARGSRSSLHSVFFPLLA